MMPQLFEADVRNDEEKRHWVRQFEETASRRAVMGTNQWAESVASLLNIEYFIGDFTAKSTFCRTPTGESNKKPLKEDRCATVLSSAFGSAFSKESTTSE